MKNIKRYLIIGVFLGILVLPSVSQADVIADLQAQINALLQQIQQLQQQLAQLQGQPVTWCHTFNVNLASGASGSEVEALGIALQKQGFKIEPGNFNESMASAVSGFQEKYKDAILTPLGLQYGTGYVGKATRAKLNSFYRCRVTPTPIVCAADVRMCSDGTYVSRIPPSCDFAPCPTPTPTPTPTSTPSITVLSPNGGENWSVGSTQTIKWSGENTNSMIQILLFPWSTKNSTSVYSPTATIALSAANTGSYSWAIPSNISGGQYFVRAFCTSNCVSNSALDDSDAPFSIVAAGGASSQLNGACGLSNGQTFISAPTINLCSAGTATAVSGSGPWTWSCTGLNGGSTASCSANAQAGNNIDLAITGISAPSGVFSGGRWTGAVYITNYSRNAARAFTVNFYLGSSTDGTPLGTLSASGLAGGASTMLGFSLTVNIGTHVSSYITVIVTPNALDTDTNPSNNTYYSGITGM